VGALSLRCFCCLLQEIYSGERFFAAGILGLGRRREQKNSGIIVHFGVWRENKLENEA
jgi:hypothetical protein